MKAIHPAILASTLFLAAAQAAFAQNHAYNQVTNLSWLVELAVI
jgi:hypothetical protein